MLPVSVVFARFSFVALALCEALLSKHCMVVVVTDEADRWEEATRHLRENANFKITNSGDSDGKDPAYIFIIEGFSNEEEELKPRLDSALEYLSAKNKKSAVILPMPRSSLEKALGTTIGDYIRLHNLSTKLILAGDIYGPRMSFSADSLVHSMLGEVILGKTVRVPAADTPLYPVFSGDLAREIIRQTWTYGPKNSKLVVASPTTAYKFLKDLQFVSPGLQYETDYTFSTTPAVDGEVTVPREEDREALGVTIKWFKTNKPRITLPKKQLPDAAELPKIQVAKIKKKFAFKKHKKFFAISGAMALVWIVALPFIALLVSGFCLRGAYRAIAANDVSRATLWLTVSHKAAVLADSFFSVSGGYPKEVSGLLVKGSDIGRKGIEVARSGQTLWKGVLSDTSYDLETSSKTLAVDLDVLYRDISLVESEVASLPALSKNLAPEVANISQIKKYVEGARQISLRLPSLLGANSPKTYLVLFQNNMELRPTGGFIGSFALVTFDKRKLLDITVSDVYAADGQLRGHVDPPAPIRDYLGEGGWYLRDANWDPDFPTTAQKVEWFLDKEIDRKVDGVIAIDLEVAKGLLDVTGPVELADYGQSITSKNLYERVQFEVEANFFPGSQKKTTFLTALTKSLLDRLTHLGNNDYYSVAKMLFDTAGAKHIQIFVHDLSTATALASIGWDGSVKIPVCKTANCQTLWMGLNEANLGVNKANYYIERNMSLYSTPTPSGFKNVLTVNLTNKGAAGLGNKGNYKVYMRLLTPVRVKMEKVELADALGTTTVKSEDVVVGTRRESGVLLEVPPGTKKKIVFRWEQEGMVDYTKPGEMYFAWVDQAGTGKDPLFIQIIQPQGRAFTADPAFTLTQGALVGYNTQSSGDFTARLFWK